MTSIYFILFADVKETTCIAAIFAKNPMLGLTTCIRHVKHKHTEQQKQQQQQQHQKQQQQQQQQKQQQQQEKQQQQKQQQQQQQIKQQQQQQDFIFYHPFTANVSGPGLVWQNVFCQNASSKLYNKDFTTSRENRLALQALATNV